MQQCSVSSKDYCTDWVCTMLVCSYYDDSINHIATCLGIGILSV